MLCFFSSYIQEANFGVSSDILCKSLHWVHDSEGLQESKYVYNSFFPFLFLCCYSVAVVVHHCFPSFCISLLDVCFSFFCTHRYAFFIYIYIQPCLSYRFVIHRLVVFILGFLRAFNVSTRVSNSFSALFFAKLFVFPVHSSLFRIKNKKSKDYKVIKTNRKIIVITPNFVAVVVSLSLSAILCSCNCAVTSILYVVCLSLYLSPKIKCV